MRFQPCLQIPEPYREPGSGVGGDDKQTVFQIPKGFRLFSLDNNKFNDIIKNMITKRRIIKTEKTVCIILAFVLILSLSACSTEQNNTSEVSAPQISTPQFNSTSKFSEFDSTHSAEDIITFEKVGYEMGGSSICNIWFKFRNNTEWNLDQLHCRVQILDENGDALDSRSMSFNDGMEPGQAAWIKFQDGNCTSSKSIEELSSKLYALKVVKIQVQSENMEGIDLYCDNPRVANFKYDSPIIVKTTDIQPKQ